MNQRPSRASQTSQRLLLVDESARGGRFAAARSCDLNPTRTPAQATHR